MTTRTITPGPVMIDVAGAELTAMERERLRHPLVGGVIIFARNFTSREQLQRLIADIRAQRNLIVAVDQEGGRVQRLRDGFCRLPPMAALGRYWDDDHSAACDAARAVGYVLAVELRGVGIDLSFAPVLDLAHGQSSVIGDRAFHQNPEAVIALAGSLIEGMHLAGLGACGKHFPGHGFVAADSHLAIPVDDRILAAIGEDIRPFQVLALDAVMPAHVIYPAMDTRPAGFSPVWLRYLREELGFKGVIFSDDLSMEGASFAGDIVGRAEAAWTAGCDMLLVCNAPDSVNQLLAEWAPEVDNERSSRIANLLPLPFSRPSAITCAHSGLFNHGTACAARLIS